MRNYHNYPFHIQTGLTQTEQQHILDLVAALGDSTKYGAFRVSRPQALRYLIGLIPQVVAALRAEQRRAENPQGDLPIGFNGL